VSTKTTILTLLATVLTLAGCGGGVQQAQPRKSVPSVSGGYGEGAQAASLKAADQVQVVEANYYGHQALRLTNGLVTVIAVPELGGRIMEYKIADMPLLWANLAEVQGGKTPTGAPKTTSAPAAWRNYGGYKTWPAPQDKWGGPPDPRGSQLEGARWVGRIAKPRGEVGEVELTSPSDAGVTGLQITRRVRLYQGTTRLEVEETFKNVSGHQIEWSIWNVTQVPGVLAEDRPDQGAMIYYPVNPNSKFKGGYRQIIDKASTQWRVLDGGLLEVTYKHELGKIGSDSDAGWMAYVDGSRHWAYVKRFAHKPGAEYPDGGCSVEVYTSPDLPYMEMEALSPPRTLAAGEEMSFTEDWYATRLGSPVREVTEAAALQQPVAVKRDGANLRVTGAFGVFLPGKVRVALMDADDKAVGKPVDIDAQPGATVTLNQAFPADPGATQVVVKLVKADGSSAGQIAAVKIPAATAAAGKGK
jgi:hypothetical protein